MKIDVKKAEGLKFENVEAREAEVQDMLNAQRASGKTEGIDYTIALFSEICLFDGKKLTVEDLRKLSMSDFLELQNGLMDGGIMGSTEQLSALLEKLGLNIQQ